MRRRASRRRRLVVAGVAAVTAAVVAGWLALHSPLFAVRHLVVSGASHSGTPDVRGAAGVRRGQAMVDVGTGAARRGVEALPWVLRATVRRSWPSTVRITVVERTAVATAAAGGGSWALLDAGGRVLDRVAQHPPGLVSIEGIPLAGRPGTSVGPPATGALRLAVVAVPALGGRADAVLVDHGALEVRLRPRGIVLLGTPDALEDKVRSAVTVLGTVDPPTVGVLDARVPASPVLTRQ